METSTKERYAETVTTTATSTETREPSGLNFSTRVVSVQLHRSYTHYNAKVAIATSVLQLLIGLYCIALGVAQPCINTTFGDSGIGIWCGAMFVVAGLVGIISSKKKTPEWIVPHMVFCILSSLLAGLLFAVAVAAAVYDNRSRLGGTPRTLTGLGVAGGNTVAVDCLLAIGAFFEGLAAIVAAAISCRVTCCNNNFHASQKEVENPNVLSYHVDEPTKYTVNPARF